MAVFDDFFGRGQQLVEGELGKTLPGDEPGDVVTNPGPRYLRRDNSLQSENSPNDNILGQPSKFGNKRLGYRS